MPERSRAHNACAQQRFPRNRRVLIAEDDDGTRKLIARVLRREGFLVDETPNGRVAAERVGGGDQYELVVLDLAMPFMSGLQVLERIRETDPRAMPHVVIVSAAVHQMRDGAPSGVCRVVPKPFELADLLDAVRACARR